MQNRELDLIPVLLGIVGVSGVYALLILVSVSNLTTIEVAILLQTVCICCGIAGLLLLLGFLRRQRRP
jgi:hypothetical protein